jgi:hypothetical protein
MIPIAAPVARYEDSCPTRLCGGEDSRRGKTRLFLPHHFSAFRAMSQRNLIGGTTRCVCRRSASRRAANDAIGANES